MRKALMNEPKMQPPAADMVLTVRRQITLSGKIFPVGSVVSLAELGRNTDALIGSHFVKWTPISQVKGSPGPRPVPKPEPAKVSVTAAEIDRLVAKHDTGGDPVAAWRALVGELAKRLGSPAAARDRLALHDRAAQLERRAQRVHAEREASHSVGPARRVVDGLYT